MAANMKVVVKLPNGQLIDSDTNQNYVGSLDGNILYIWDVTTKTNIDNLTKTCGQPKYIIGDSMSYFKGINAIDYWIESQVRQFEKDNISLPNEVSTAACANFTLNKKSHNRHMILKLSEIFNVDVNYTWSGIDRYFDMSLFIDEHISINDNKIDNVWGGLLSPITRFEKKWINHATDIDLGFAIGYAGNTNVWEAGLKDLISVTAVTLIGESICDDTDAITYSEKTAFSVYGLTMPIWVGGKYQAKYWKEKGFDTFDDIIDHSYESMPTLLERCFYAIYLNRKILTDLDYAAQVRTDVMDRLIANREKLTYQHLHDFNVAQVAAWPEEIKDIAYPLFDKYEQFKF
jgi:hypothetical protein